MPGLIAGADPQQLCFECLGPDHAEDELEMVDVGDQDMAEATPPTFATSARRVMAPFAEEEEDDFDPPPLLPKPAASTRGFTVQSGPPGATGFHLAPLARYLAVCGGVVATATENQSSGGRNGRYFEGAGPHGDLKSPR